MESDMGKYFTSPLFTFQIGPDKQEFTIHSYLLAKLSPSLNRLMNGGMRESKDRTVHWPDVDPDTFIRLCEFAHVGDYTPPSSGTREDYDKDEVSEPSEECSECSDIAESETSEEAPSGRGKPLPQLPPRAKLSEAGSEFSYMKNIGLNGLMCAYHGRYRPTRPENTIFSTSTYNSPGNTGPWDDFAQVFLGQGQLYVLADKYGIESLCQLVIYKLDQTLRPFKLYPSNVNDVLELVRFAYANTPPDYGDKRDPLRDLMSRYAVYAYGELSAIEPFRTILEEEGGQFVEDFWDIVDSLDIRAAPSTLQKT